MPRLFSQALDHRAAMVALDAEEARDEACFIALQAGAGFACAGMAGVMFNLLLAALVWELPSRNIYLASFFAFEAVVAVCVLGLFWRRLRSWRPFSGFLKQIKADYACWNDSDTP